MTTWVLLLIPLRAPSLTSPHTPPPERQRSQWSHLSDGNTGALVGTAPKLVSWTQPRVPCAGFRTLTPSRIFQAEREKQDKSGGAPPANVKVSPGNRLTKSRGSQGVTGPVRNAPSQAAPASRERWAALWVSLMHAEV